MNLKGTDNAYHQTSGTEQDLGSIIQGSTQNIDHLWLKGTGLGVQVL